jgi:hypothetical protein
LPLVPPTAVLTGIVVDKLLGSGSPAKPGMFAKYFGTALAGVFLVLYGIMRFFPRRFGGGAFSAAPPSRAWGVALLLVGVALVVLAVRRFGSSATSDSEPGDPKARYDAGVVALFGVASAVVIALVGRDFLPTRPGNLDGQIRLMHLFTYNYSRPWPESLDFTGAFAAFTLVAAVFSLGVVSRRFRGQATALFCVTAALWAAWGLDVYLYKCAPHWGQRETIMAYYRDRTNANQPFVAYQMNWKGENFYMSNQVPAFVSSGERFKEWVNDQKAHGIKRLYFTSEHGRSGSLKRELGDPPSYTEITDKTLNNKFFVARVIY